MLKRSAGALAAGLILPQAIFGQKSSAKAISVGILGAAHIHLEQYARLLQSDDAVRVKAVYDETSAIAERAVKLTGGRRVSSVEDLLADDEINAVIILSENVRHEGYAVAAAAAGKHMFVEKPLEIQGDRADRIAQAVERSGVLFQTGYFMQSMPQLRFLRKAIRDGKFGKLTRLRLQYAHGGSLSGMWNGQHAWMVDRAQVGRGALGDLGIHLVNALLWMTEGDPVRSISACVGNATGRYHEIDEYGEAILCFESGLIATLGAGYVDLNDVNRIELSGTAGHAYVNQGRTFLTAPAITGKKQERYWSDFPDPLEHPFSSFLAAVRGEDVPLISAGEAARDVRVMDEIYRAAKS